MAGKNHNAALEQIKQGEYSLEEAIALLQEVKYAKFDETAEIAINLGVNPRHADQMVRGTVVLPNVVPKFSERMRSSGSSPGKHRLRTLNSNSGKRWCS